MLPLLLRLKKQAHKDLARAQDLLVLALYRVFDKAVLHGGTAIWRCHQGQRFSEDLDVYLPKDLAKVDALFAAFQQQGFMITKKKISDTSIYSTLVFQRTTVRFEALFKRIEGSLREYESADGNYITVYTLPPEALIQEKVSAYLSRRKVRDLYDIFFLLRSVSSFPLVRQSLQNLLTHYQSPLDEKELRVLILEGVVPTSSQMLEYIQRRLYHG